MTQSMAGTAGGGSEQELKLRLQGLQHEVEKSAGLVRRLAIMAIFLVLALILLLIAIYLYNVMQYAQVESVEATKLANKPGAAEIHYKPSTAGKIEFVRESEGLVQTLTEYAGDPAAGAKEGKFEWSGKPGERSLIRVTYRSGFFLVTTNLTL
jgi:hypothetical protein